MKILVTGGTVFASRFTAEYFVGRGHSVYALNRGTREQSAGVHHINCDRHALGSVLKGYDFDAVIDVCCYNEADAAALVNALDGIKQYIFVSSSAVYPETLRQPFAEKQPCGENSHWGAYGVNKIAAERYLFEKVPQAYIIRPPYLYGKMNNLYREAFVFDCAERDRPFYIPHDGKMPLQFFDIEDMCRFMEILLEKQPEEHIFNVGNPQSVEVGDWVRLCYGTLGKSPVIRYVDGGVNQREYFPFLNYGYRLCVDRMLQLMSDVKPLEKGLEESYLWYRKNREQVRIKPLIEFIDRNFNNSV